MSSEANYRQQWAEGEIEAGTLLDAIDDLRAQLAAIQGGMGEVVEVVASLQAERLLGNAGEYAIVIEKHSWLRECQRTGGSFDLMTVAQHQRITEAMAAEVERLKAEVERLYRVADQAWAKADQFGNEMLWSRWDQAKHGGFKAVLAERDALRAELAEVKGRKPDCFVVGKSDKIAVIDSPLPVGTKLYTTPPASPDVEGLVKALEDAITDVEEWAAYASPYFQEKHDLAGCLEKHRAAISAWRQAQVKP